MICTLIVVVLGIWWKDLYYWSGLYVDGNDYHQYQEGVISRYLDESLAKEALLWNIAGRKWKKPHYTRADGKENIKKVIEWVSTENPEYKYDRPLDIIHFPYGTHKTLDIKAKKSRIHFLLSDRPVKCGADDSWRALSEKHFSLVEDYVADIRIKAVNENYRKMSPCGQWSDVMVANKNTIIVDGTGSIDLPYGDKTLKEKTVFVFIEGESYKNHLERTLKK